MAFHRVKVGTYNVNNFYDRFDDPYNYSDDRWGPMTTKPKKLEQIYHLGARLREDKPGILALQEVENKGAVYEFNVSQLGDHFRDMVVIESNDPRGIQVGLASTFPLGQVVSYQFLRDLGDRQRGKIFSRDLLEVEILDPDTYLYLCTIFVTHLKSQYVDQGLSEADKQAAEQRATYRRSRQAMAIAQIILRRFPEPQNAFFMLMGDLNDTPDSQSLRPLLQHPKLGLYNILEELPADKRWTHYWPEQKHYSQLDYILLSPAMRTRLVPDTATVIQRGFTQGSDHRPVYVDVLLGWE